MVHIQKNSEDISSVIGVRTKDIGSGQIWDDSPDNIIEIRFFKKSGVFLTNEEVKKLENWLNDYAEMLYFNGKSVRQNNKSDISEAKEVSTFLGELRSLEV